MECVEVITMNDFYLRVDHDTLPLKIHLDDVDNPDTKLEYLEINKNLLNKTRGNLQDCIKLMTKRNKLPKQTWIIDYLE